jgi:hypothetical protein
METVLPYVLANEHWKIERLPNKASAQADSRPSEIARLHGPLNGVCGFSLTICHFALFRSG